MAIVDATGKIDMALWDRLGQAEHWPCARCGLKHKIGVPWCACEDERERLTKSGTSGGVKHAD